MKYCYFTVYILICLLTTDRMTSCKTELIFSCQKSDALHNFQNMYVIVQAALHSHIVRWHLWRKMNAPDKTLAFLTWYVII